MRSLLLLVASIVVAGVTSAAADEVKAPISASMFLSTMTAPIEGREAAFDRSHRGHLAVDGIDAAPIGRRNRDQAGAPHHERGDVGADPAASEVAGVRRDEHPPTPDDPKEPPGSRRGQQVDGQQYEVRQRVEAVVCQQQP